MPKKKKKNIGPIYTLYKPTKINFCLTLCNILSLKFGFKMICNFLKLRILRNIYKNKLVAFHKKSYLNYNLNSKRVPIKK